MFEVKIENYRNDYDKYYETLYFNSLEELSNFLIKENEKRDDTPKSSKYWRNPAGVFKSEVRGYFRTNRSGRAYSLWLKTVKYNDVTVFEESNYCSPKFYEFLKQLEQKFEQKPVYGDF